MSVDQTEVSANVAATRLKTALKTLKTVGSRRRGPRLTTFATLEAKNSDAGFAFEEIPNNLEIRPGVMCLPGAKSRQTLRRRQTRPALLFKRNPDLQTGLSSGHRLCPIGRISAFC